MPATAATPENDRQRAVLSFPLDLVTVGGLSLAAVVLYASSGSVSSPVNVLQRFTVLTAAINFPHFMASYALLYPAPAMVARHRIVSYVLPAVLLLWMVIGVAVWKTTPHVSNLMTALACVLLAWHYTGQTFGMMASYAFIEGVSFTPVERLLLRTNLSALLGWHVLWALGAFIRAGSTDPQARTLVTHDVHVAAPFALASALFGAAAMWKVRRRIGRWPGSRVTLPWLTVHSWYALMAVDDRALFIAQIAHALQYLPFPLRVHLNRTQGSRRLPAWRAASYLGILMVAGKAAFDWGPGLVQHGASLVGWSIPQLAEAFGSVLNIHHYFVDGAVWKISDPQVRKDLFAHLAAPASVSRPSPACTWPDARGGRRPPDGRDS